MSSLVILVGPKGSGKTTLGKHLADNLDSCSFLEVEKIFMTVISEGHTDIIKVALERVDEAIAEQFKTFRVVVMESTAAGIDFPALVVSYKEKFGRVLLFRVRVTRDVCLGRVYSRDQTNQIQVSHDRLVAYHDQSDQVEMAWDLEIFNEDSADFAVITESARAIIDVA